MTKISDESWYIINYYPNVDGRIEIASDKKIIADRITEILGTLSESSKQRLRDFLEKGSPLTDVLSLRDNQPFTGLRGIVYLYPATRVVDGR